MKDLSWFPWDREKLIKESAEKKINDREKGFSPQRKRILMNYDKNVGYTLEQGYYY